MEDIRLIRFDSESIEYLAPSWDDMDRIVFDIAQKISADGLSFDRVVTLAKGGWPMSRPLIDYTQIEEVASIGLKFYSGIDERLEEPVVYQDVPVDVAGETILLFDDVADTGESLEFTKKYLEERGAAKIMTACLFYKPHSSIKPDYYGTETTSWIIFPYELRETITILAKKWREQSLSTEAIAGRFVELGFQQDMVHQLLIDIS